MSGDNYTTNNARGDERGDAIELSLPLNAAYLAAARLTASSIANRIGFDAEEIEDVKAAVGEACAFMIRGAGHCGEGDFKVRFIVSGDTMSITLSCPLDFSGADADGDMGLAVIRAVMDTTVVDVSASGILIVLSKKHKENVFE